ncbi:hypothetical protein EDM59_01795 [Brevibacillus nitrificans]|uniref:Uncharacterized protein n=1 Tax=Brevibacillus nitrificans TaxID=651560 RepID=A0A3M8DQ52_9BACL|nr:hypothetical protein EDM59_01795 [Brevibacillus nitrificans]
MRDRFYWKASKWERSADEVGFFVFAKCLKHIEGQHLSFKEIVPVKTIGSTIKRIGRSVEPHGRWAIRFDRSAIWRKKDNLKVYH